MSVPCWSRCCRRAEADPVRRRRAELHRQGVGRTMRTVRWALMYPDAYEVGLPNQGVQILYEVLNERDWILAERTYAVWPDLEAVMRDARHPAVHRRRAPPGGRVRPLRHLASRPSSVTPTCSTPSTSPASRCTRSTAARTTRSSSPAGTRPSTPSRSPTSSTRPCSVTARRSCLPSPRSSASGRPRDKPGGRDELLRRLAASRGVYVPQFYDVTYAADGSHRGGRAQQARHPVPGPQAHADGPRPVAVPGQAARTARRDRARAVLRGDLPRLHARLPVLPGRA